jgi:hypothetical protein
MENDQDYENMSVEELGNILPEQGSPNVEKPSAVENTLPADTSNASGTVPEVVNPKSDDTISKIEKRLEITEKLMDGLNRQSRQWQALQGKFDELKNILTQRQNNALSPQETADQSAKEAAEKFLNDRIEEKAKALIEREYGSLIGPIREQQLNQAIESQVAELDVDWKEMEPILAGIIKSDSELAQSGDVPAKQRLMALASGNTQALILRGLIARSKNIKSQGATVKASTNSDAGSRLVKTGQQATNSGKKKPEEMSEEELDSMDIKELEKLIPRQRNIRG